MVDFESLIFGLDINAIIRAIITIMRRAMV